MILTINANAALDRIFFIPRFIPDTHMRVQKEVLGIGGKGLDTSLVLKTLQAPSRAISFIAGENGKTLAGLLSRHGIDADLIWVPGETRVANVIVETELNRHSHVTTSGYTVTPADCQVFLARVEEHACSAQWAVIAGSLPGGAPVGFYRAVIERLHLHQVRVLIDNTGPPLVEALAAHPEVVKMNQAEFQATFQVQAGGLEAWTRECRRQMDRYGIPALVLTRGRDGILAFTPDGDYQAGSAPVPEVNAAGAGDAASAALAYRRSLGDPWSQALRWAAAASAAVVKTEGTAECYLAEILALYQTAWVRQVQQ